MFRNLKLALLTFVMIVSLASLTYGYSLSQTNTISITSLPNQISISGTEQYSFQIRNNSGASNSFDICQVTSSHGGQTQPSLTIQSASFNVNGELKYPDSINPVSATVTNLFFFNPVSIDPGITVSANMSVKASPELNIGKVITTKVNCLFGNGDNVSSSSRTISILDPNPCAGLTCGCGSLPACEVSPLEPAPSSTPPQTTPSSPSTSGGSESSNSDVPTEAEVEAVEKDKPIQLPEIFLNKDSKSTDLSSLEQEQLRNVKNLILDIPAMNMIEFQEPIDLYIDGRIEELGDVVVLSKKGLVEVNASKAGYLNIPAKVTMRNLDFFSTPMILKNGVQASNEEVRIINYNRATGTLEFEVIGFSTYEAVEQIESEHTGSDEQTSNILVWSMIGSISVFAILCLAGFTAYSVYKKKKTTKSE